MTIQKNAVGKASEVTTVELGEMKMVGFPVNVAFKGGDFSQIGKIKQRFMERKGEIQHVINPDFTGRLGIIARLCSPTSIAWKSANSRISRMA